MLINQDENLNVELLMKLVGNLNVEILRTWDEKASVAVNSVVKVNSAAKDNEVLLMKLDEKVKLVVILDVKA